MALVAGGGGTLQGFQVQGKAFFLNVGHLHRNTAGQLDHLHIAYPAGSGQKYLVALFHQCLHRIEEGLLGSGTHRDLVGSIRDLVVPQKLVTDGLPQRGNAETAVYLV